MKGDEEMLKNEEIKQKLSNLSLNTDEMIILTALLNLVLNKVDAQDYKDAISLFNQLDKNAEITAAVHVNMCKRLSQSLNEHRKQQQHTDKNHQQIQDVNILIDFVEKKLKLKSTYTVTVSPVASMLPVIRPPIIINQSDLNSTIENEIQK